MTKIEQLPWVVECDLCGRKLTPSTAGQATAETILCKPCLERVVGERHPATEGEGRTK